MHLRKVPKARKTNVKYRYIKYYSRIRSEHRRHQQNIKKVWRKHFQFWQRIPPIRWKYWVLEPNKSLRTLQKLHLYLKYPKKFYYPPLKYATNYNSSKQHNPLPTTRTQHFHQFLRNRIILFPNSQQWPIRLKKKLIHNLQRNTQLQNTQIP